MWAANVRVAAELNSQCMVIDAVDSEHAASQPCSAPGGSNALGSVIVRSKSKGH
jgi:hypothetical protein